MRRVMRRKDGGRRWRRRGEAMRVREQVVVVERRCPGVERPC